MALWNEKIRITVGSVSLELPEIMVRDQKHPVDTSAGVFEAEGLTVIVDEGPFADRLDRGGGAEYEEKIIELAGYTGRLISYLVPSESTRVTGFHTTAPQSFTVHVRAGASVPTSVVEDIFCSLKSSNDHSGGDTDVELKP